MVVKVFVKHDIRLYNEVQQNLAFWLSKDPSERISAVELLRRLNNGNSTDFKELFRLFNAHSIRYIIVGSYALAFHGAPRFTGDIDILVKPDPENADKIMRALNDFGFGSVGLEESYTTALRATRPVRPLRTKQGNQESSLM